MANSPPNHPVIFKIAIPISIDTLFDYLPPEQTLQMPIQPGTRVLVPFGKKTKVGFVIESVKQTTIHLNRLKHIIEILDPSPLISPSDLKFLKWASRYYHHPLAEVFSTAFPIALRKGKPAELLSENFYHLSDKGKCLVAEQLKRTPRQQQIFQRLQSNHQGLSASSLNTLEKNWRTAMKALLEKSLVVIESCPVIPIKSATQSQPALLANHQQSHAIDQLITELGSFSVTLLEGITGSGKTEVYMQVIQQVLNLGQQVLVLLPEITLTPQLQNRFKKRFSTAISISHSKLTESQRLSAWLEMQQGHSSILLGTRSALFTPLKNPGLIILDEEHDTSFKQQRGFLFSARDLAIVRGKLLNIPVILGTATPSLESLYNTEQQRYKHLHLTERAGVASNPKFILLDIRNKKLQEGLAEPLITQIQKTLEKNEQVLLFLNRRGFAPILICHHCGWVARCHQCDSSLVIHYEEKVLRCHHCGNQHNLLKHCPSCKTGELKPLGLGTERIEKHLIHLFPKHTVLRLDRDSTQRKGSLESHLQQINQGQVDIILGTQMLAKGHHFPNVTLVAILDVDSGLFSIDFHATEKLAQLIIQVAGRAGRAEKPGKVILQTRQPDHPLLTILLNQGYADFAKTALAERQQACLPPYSFQALLRVYARNPNSPQSFLQQVCAQINKLENTHTLILGPVSAPMAKREGNYHFQLLLQNKQRKLLHNLLQQLVPQLYQLKEAKKVRWSIDIDPVDLY